MVNDYGMSFYEYTPLVWKTKGDKQLHVPCTSLAGINPTQYEYSVAKPHFVHNQVDFVRGKPPVLTIYDASSGEAGETINLEKFNIEEVRCVEYLYAR